MVNELRIPTALSPREVNCLQRRANNRRVIEAGALLGYSTVKLSDAASSVISIDKHDGYSGPTLKPYMHNIWQYGRANVLPVQGDALVEMPKFWGDFGFIDLTGQAILTKEALQKIRCPIVGIHDFQRANCEGVEQAIQGMEVLETVDSLIVVRNKFYHG